jgi:hypothetical protein
MSEEPIGRAAERMQPHIEGHEYRFQLQRLFLYSSGVHSSGMTPIPVNNTI